MVGGDWNCKIGEIQSEAGDRIYERQSISKKVDTRGKKMMEIMNANNMVVLNGVGGKRAEHIEKEIVMVLMITLQSAAGWFIRYLI